VPRAACSAPPDSLLAEPRPRRSSQRSLPICTDRRLEFLRACCRGCYRAVRFGFQSGAALATVVGVLVEVPVMLSVVRIVLRTRGWYHSA
jgi:hypothetical protein